MQTKLKLGKMTGQEIAKWMGITYATYRNNPKKYLERLDDFCDFEPVRGGALIKQIYIEKYQKDLLLKQTRIYLKALKEHNNYISLTGLEKTTGLSAYQSRKIRNKLFGDLPINIKPGAHGLMGFRERVWAIKLGDNNYRLFSPEEEEIFNTLIKKIIQIK